MDDSEFSQGPKAQQLKDLEERRLSTMKNVIKSSLGLLANNTVIASISSLKMERLPASGVQRRSMSSLLNKNHGAILKSVLLQSFIR
uniref:Uncharacterized protein n=1 Tax=Ditylenchus dipsaci TaxID=166011 RepID=A0A915CQH6_9BILA